MEGQNYLNATLDMVDGRGATQNAEEGYEFVVKHGMSNNHTTFYACSLNTLYQVFEGTAKELGFKEGKKPIYMNENNQSTADSEMTLGEFGVKEGSVLTILTEAEVAATN